MARQRVLSGHVRKCIILKIKSALCPWQNRSVAFVLLLPVHFQAVNVTFTSNAPINAF